jgi:hypothetical protein
MTVAPETSSDDLFEASRGLFEGLVGVLSGQQAAALSHFELEVRLQVDGRELLRQPLRTITWRRNSDACTALATPTTSSQGRRNGPLRRAAPESIRPFRGTALQGGRLLIASRLSVLTGLRRVPLEIEASHSPDQRVLWKSRDSGG